MTLVAVLANTVENKYPNYLQLSKKQRREILVSVLKKSVRTAISRVHLPDPKDSVQKRIEKFQYDRSSKHFQLNHKLTNWALYERIANLRANKTIYDSSTLDLFKKISDAVFSGKSTHTTADNNIQVDPHYDFSDYSENNSRKKAQLFKTLPFDFANADRLNIKNQITRYQIALSHSRDLMVMTDTSKRSGSKDSSLVSLFEIQSPNFAISNKSITDKTKIDSIHFTESLFLLYDLDSFIQFITSLHKYNKKNEQIFNDELKYAYETLKEFYLKLLLKYDSNVKDNNLEEFLLSNPAFQTLHIENPLKRGLSLLITKSIDFETISSIATSKNFPKIILDYKLNPTEIKYQRPDTSLNEEEQISTFISECGEIPLNIIQRKFLFFKTPIFDFVKSLLINDLVSIRKQPDGTIMIKSKKIS